MHTTNYRSTLITVAPDTKATLARAPEKAGTVAALQYELLVAKPYLLTSDDLIFLVHTQRANIDPTMSERAAFFAKPQACLRGSPLPKTFGFGLHHDENSFVAPIPMGSDRYAELGRRSDVKIIPAMRSSRS